MDARRMILAVGVVVVLSIGILAACCPVTPGSPGESGPTTTPREEPTTRPTEEGASSTEVPTDVPEPTTAISPLESPLESPIEPPPAPLDGQVLLQERCTVCHDLVRVTGAKKDRAGWEQSVDRMIGKGAELNAEERDVLIGYLAEIYGE